jgi:acyl-CoA synthetase (AMP-forming)/AMP-acid ligase II
MPTIASTLRSSARRVPDAEALRFGELRYSYAELDAAVDRYAAALLALGVAKGERVAVMSGNSDRFVLAFYATLRIGAIFVPVNPAYAPPEVDHVLADSGAAVLLFDPKLVATLTRTAQDPPLPPEVRHVLALDTCPGFGSLPDHLPDQAGACEVDVAETDDALILYTSGTTGAAKGALFDHHRTLWVAASITATCGLRAGDRLLHVAPLYHAAQLCVMLVPGVLIGAANIVLPGFQPADVLDVMERERITMFFGVPTMFQLMMRSTGAGERDLSAWRTGLFGAAPMPAAAVQQLTATWPGVAFMQLCGQTEGGPSGIYSTHEQVLARPDASGRQAVVLVETRVVDPAGVDVAPGGTGELLLRGETVMKRYWNNPEATAATLRDGWLHTGDVVRLDPDGYLTIVDRLKDMIITGGRNVYSVEVENALAAHPAIRDAAVVGRPHPDYGESIVAVVDAADPDAVTLAELREFCSSRIADYKLPHDVVLAPIPRNASGKVLKHLLRERLV